jgi:deoxyribodipyrimidine photo-lyase
MITTLIWFRRDLRLLDNPALHWALTHSDRIIPVYVHAPDEEQPWAPGGASRWWLHHSLQRLAQNLDHYGLRLITLRGPSGQALQQLIKVSGVTQLAFNQLYDPLLIKRDQQIGEQLRQQGIEVFAAHGNLLFEPGRVVNQQQAPYRVYTPFYKRTRSLLDELYSHYKPLNDSRKLKQCATQPALRGVKPQPLDLLDPHPWHDKLHNYWQPGERRAHQQLHGFIENSLNDYPEQRDRPAVDGTSQLSPHLHFGEITPQQIYIELRPLLCGGAGSRPAQAAEKFLSQLIWREFAHQILWFYPHTSDQPMNPRYNTRFWRSSKKQFQRWCRGETGIPIVDAGMKQLWETGWMHNRVRMIVASLLTKNLGISWLQGARWFWDTLVDADLANNAMGWQWVAGSGVDAAPYYRIFNPQTQTERFDAGLDYVDHWLPQHRQPEYPKPIVDLAESRQRALDRYRDFISTQD